MTSEVTRHRIPPEYVLTSSTGVSVRVMGSVGVGGSNTYPYSSVWLCCSMWLWRYPALTSSWGRMYQVRSPNPATSFRSLLVCSTAGLPYGWGGCTPAASSSVRRELVVEDSSW